MPCPDLCLSLPGASAQTLCLHDLVVFRIHWLPHMETVHEGGNRGPLWMCEGGKKTMLTQRQTNVSWEHTILHKISLSLPGASAKSHVVIYLGERPRHPAPLFPATLLSSVYDTLRNGDTRTGNHDHWDDHWMWVGGRRCRHHRKLQLPVLARPPQYLGRVFGRRWRVVDTLGEPVHVPVGHGHVPRDGCPTSNTS